jgi:hypothetical protein
MTEDSKIEDIIRLHWGILAAMQFSSRPDWMELEMTMAQIKALFTISQGKSVTVSRIGEYLGVGQPLPATWWTKLSAPGWHPENPDDGVSSSFV